MADDVLGHDHLDHGKHLHKPGFHPKPAYWMGIWVKHPREAHEEHHHDSHGAHGHPKPAQSHAHSEEHHISPGKVSDFFSELSWLQLAIVLAVIIPAGLFIYRSWVGLLVAAAVIGLNVVVEFHKWFTEGSPLDFEILTFGAAYLAATGYMFWALAVATVGPYVSYKSRGIIDEDTAFRIFGVAVAAFAGLVLGPAVWSVFIAVIFGVFAQFMIASLIADNGPIFNAIESGTTVALAAYLAFFILPMLPFI